METGPHHNMLRMQRFSTSCWASHGCVAVQSAAEKAHDVKKAAPVKKKAAPKKVMAVSALCLAGKVLVVCGVCPVATMPSDTCSEDK